MEWLGSIAWDGYPSGTPENLGLAKTEAEYRREVDEILSGDDSATRPEQGWPWPWEDSRTTDYSYTWDGEKPLACCFGWEWIPAAKWDEDVWDSDLPEKLVGFPDMTARQSVARGKRSGIIAVTARGLEC